MQDSNQFKEVDGGSKKVYIKFLFIWLLRIIYCKGFSYSKELRDKKGANILESLGTLPVDIPLILNKSVREI